MRSLVLFIILMFFSLSAYSQEQKEISEASDYALQFVKKRGGVKGKTEFLCEWSTGRIMLLQNTERNVFLIMARKPYAGQMKERVLAFSIGYPFVMNDTSMKLLLYYNRIVGLLSESGELSVYRDTSTVRVQQMLRQIRWTQFGLHEIYEGQAGSMVSGCGPVAVAQIMKYYNSPDTVRHDYCYLAKDGRTIKAKMDGTPIDWKCVKDRYTKEDQDSTQLNELMKMVGVSLNVRYGENLTTTSMSYIKRAMVRHFGFSASMFLAYSNLRQSDLCRLVRKYLVEGKPAIMCGMSHIFVCDGAYDNYLHLNMGWGGACDGWYSMLDLPIQTGAYSVFASAILNICPETKRLEKTVTLTKAGTLANVLTDEEKQNVAKLTVKGPINGSDIYLIRRMAGYDDAQWYDSWHGKLADLDISEAKITPDDTSYGLFDAKQVDFHERVNGIAYNGRNINHSQFVEYSKHKGEEDRSFEIIELVPDSQYAIKARPYPNVISKWMFMRCENLRSIAFPRHVRSIVERAFAECTQLEEVRIPMSVKHLASGVFAGDLSLSRVLVPQESMLKEKKSMNPSDRGYIFKGCNPELRIEYY